MRKAFIIILSLITINGFTQQKKLVSKASINREDSGRIKIKRLGINSEMSDFSPYVLNDRLLFVSGRYNSLGIVYNSDVHEVTDLFIATKTDSIKFKNVLAMDEPINSRANEGPFTTNRKGDIIYFTGNDRSNNLKIFQSQKINDIWTTPQIASFCKDGFSYCHPTLSEDEKTMYFSSDMTGGIGGMDIFVTHFKGKAWSAPKNLGKKINSTANELFPFIAEKNTLYFSSNRQTGLGGLDIYAFNIKDTLKGQLQNFLSPINSRADDFGVWIDSTLQKGYFSTNRISKNRDDIYFFYTWLPDFNDCKKIPVKNTFCYTFFEENTISEKDTSNFTHEWSFGDGKKSRGLKTKHCYNNPGNYLVQLNIIQKVSGETFLSEVAYTLTVESHSQLVVDCQDTVMVEKDLVINSEQSSLKDHEILETYWSFGDGFYNSGSLVKHIYKKPGNYKIELMVIAKNKLTLKNEKFKTEKKIAVKDNVGYAKK